MNAEIKKIIGKNIRVLREKAGLTQDLLATRLQVNGCDITRGAIAKIEIGERHLYPDEIIALREVLHTSFEAILLLPE